MSKKAWSPGRSRRSANVCGCGLQRSPEIALIASTCSEPSSNSTFIAAATTSFSLHPGPQHAGRSPRRPRRRSPAAWSSSASSSSVLSLRASSITGCESATSDPVPLQREQRRHVRDVHADRLLARARARASSSTIIGRKRVRDPGRVGHRATHRRHPRAPARLRQPRAVELVMPRGRAEVPQHRIAVAARHEREADVLVALPRPDRRARDVAEVVRVEEQQRAEIRRLERRLRPCRGGRCAAGRS